MSQTICFVEDSDLDFELAEVAVRQVVPAADVVRAISCQDGAAVIRERTPALVFLDIHLPTCNGLDILRTIATLTEIHGLAKIATVVFTTSTNPADREHALAAGAIDFRSKPTDARQFIDTVKDVVRSWMA